MPYSLQNPAVLSVLTYTISYKTAVKVHLKSDRIALHRGKTCLRKPELVNYFYVTIQAKHDLIRVLHTQFQAF